MVFVQYRKCLCKVTALPHAREREVSGYQDSWRRLSICIFPLVSSSSLHIYLTVCAFPLRNVSRGTSVSRPPASTGVCVPRRHESLATSVSVPTLVTTVVPATRVRKENNVLFPGLGASPYDVSCFLVWLCVVCVCLCH